MDHICRIVLAPRPFNVSVNVQHLGIGNVVCGHQTRTEMILSKASFPAVNQLCCYSPSTEPSIAAVSGDYNLKASSALTREHGRPITTANCQFLRSVEPLYFQAQQQATGSRIRKADKKGWGRVGFIGNPIRLSA